MDTGCQEMRGVAVAKVVEAYLQKLMPTQEPAKAAGQRAGLNRCAVFVGKDMMVSSHSHANFQQPLGLL